MTIKDITERLNKKTPGGERVQFVTILYATVTEVNMENSQSDVLITRWYVIIQLIFIFCRIHKIIVTN